MAGRALYDDPKRTERECPYMVEIPVPNNGFGETLDLMLLFHTKLNITSRRGHGRRVADRDYARWCFEDRLHAKSFCNMFDGAIIESDLRST